MKYILTTICLLIMFSGGLVEAKANKSMKKSKRSPASVSDSYVDFDDLAIEGQNRKSSAFHFLERVSKDKDSKVRKRKDFRSEIMESL